jgi:hypothetical protein
MARKPKPAPLRYSPRALRELIDKEFDRRLDSDPQFQATPTAERSTWIVRARIGEPSDRGIPQVRDEVDVELTGPQLWGFLIGWLDASEGYEGLEKYAATKADEW